MRALEMRLKSWIQGNAVLNAGGFLLWCQWRETGDKIVTNKNKEENTKPNKTTKPKRDGSTTGEPSEAWKSTGHLVLSAQAESQDK